MSQPVAGGSQVEAQGREINATLTMRDNAPWLAMCVISISIRPAPAARTQQRMWPPDGDAAGFPWLARSAATLRGMLAVGTKIWPHRWGCGDQRGYLNALQRPGGYRVWPADDQRRVGERPSGVRTSLKGRLHGNKTDAFADFFGVSTPVKDSPFDIDYDLHWRAPPWSPDVASLNGIIKSHLGKGSLPT